MADEQLEELRARVPPHVKEAVQAWATAHGVTVSAACNVLLTGALEVEGSDVRSPGAKIARLVECLRWTLNSMPSHYDGPRARINATLKAVDRDG